VVTGGSGGGVGVGGLVHDDPASGVAFDRLAASKRSTNAPFGSSTLCITEPYPSDIPFAALPGILNKASRVSEILKTSSELVMESFRGAISS
jgi:hypothetical protein